MTLAILKGPAHSLNYLARAAPVEGGLVPFCFPRPPRRCARHSTITPCMRRASLKTNVKHQPAPACILYCALLCHVTICSALPAGPQHRPTLLRNSYSLRHSDFAHCAFARHAHFNNYLRFAHCAPRPPIARRLPRNFLSAER